MENTVPNTKMEHLALLEENIREAMRRRNLDPREDRDAVRALIGECLDEYEQKRTRVSLPDAGERSVVIQRLHDEICGFGVIQPFLDDESVEEIWINSPDEIFIARNGESELTGLHLSPRAINSLLERMLKPSGRRLDLSSPFVDASLPDGSRPHAVIPDITRRHTSINIRKFVVRARRLPDLVRMNSLSAGAASLLHAAVESGMNILVSGATQSGKTTMLNCLSASIPPRERVVTCEEIFECRCETWWACNAASRTLRVPAPSSYAAWSRKPCVCARTASSLARYARQNPWICSLRSTRVCPACARFTRTRHATP